MRSIILFAFQALFLSCSIFAEASPDKYTWPKEISAIDDEIFGHQVPFSQLPPHACIRETVTPNTGTTGALYIDLNGDGVKELILDTGEGGSGGPELRIYQQSQGIWKDIGGFQGGVILCQKANGYYQLEVKSRGGAGTTNKSLYRFVDGSYRAVRSEDYKDGEFVRSLNAKELESLNN